MLARHIGQLLQGREAAPASERSFGRAKNVIFLYLAGGPPQHETFDPKPDAPAEIRGPFNSIRTNIPGIHFCELLPRTAAIADRLAQPEGQWQPFERSGHWRPLFFRDPQRVPLDELMAR